MSRASTLESKRREDDDDDLDMDDDDDATDQPQRYAQATTSKRTNSHLPWIEKYRPRSLDDVSYQDDVVNTLKRSLQSGNLPHLLFYGPPGTGR